ncbi:MAG: hypothetical protein AB1435_02235, partial [Chloroflexota bacterium]
GEGRKAAGRLPFPARSVGEGVGGWGANPSAQVPSPNSLFVDPEQGCVQNLSGSGDAALLRP